MDSDVSGAVRRTLHRLGPRTRRLTLPGGVYARDVVRCEFGECDREGAVLVWGNAQSVGRPDIGWTGPLPMCEQHAEAMIAVEAIARAEYPEGRTFEG